MINPRICPRGICFQVRKKYLAFSWVSFLNSVILPIFLFIAVDRKNTRTYPTSHNGLEIKYAAVFGDDMGRSAQWNILHLKLNLPYMTFIYDWLPAYKRMHWEYLSLYNIKIALYVVLNRYYFRYRFNSGYLDMFYSLSNLSLTVINSLRPRQNGRRFADDLFKCIFLNENARISIKISLKFIPKGPINNIQHWFR